MKKKKTGFRDIWMIWDKPKKNEDKKGSGKKMDQNNTLLT